MLAIFKRLFSYGQAIDYADLVAKGAIILDVRSSSEFRGGHIKSAINIPLDNLRGNLSVLKKDKTIITCCASGRRSALAINILKASGFSNVHNGGGWMSLQNKIR